MKVFSLLLATLWLLPLASNAQEAKPVTRIHRCGDSPIVNPTQALSRGLCEFQVISQVCLASGSHAWQIVQGQDTWTVTTTDACSSWAVILRASTGSVLSLRENTAGR